MELAGADCVRCMPGVRTRAFGSSSGLTERSHQVAALTLGRIAVVRRNLTRVLCHQEWQSEHTTGYQENDYPQCDSESEGHDCSFAWRYCTACASDPDRAVGPFFSGARKQGEIFVSRLGTTRASGASHWQSEVTRHSGGCCRTNPAALSAPDTNRASVAHLRPRSALHGTKRGCPQA